MCLQRVINTSISVETACAGRVRQSLTLALCGFVQFTDLKHACCKKEKGGPGGFEGRKCRGESRLAGLTIPLSLAWQSAWFSWSRRPGNFNCHNRYVILRTASRCPRLNLLQHKLDGTGQFIGRNRAE